MARYSVWKHEYNDQWILQNYNGKCTRDFLNRYTQETGHKVAIETFRKHVHSLGCKTTYYYTQEELDFVRDNYHRLSSSECAEQLGVSLNRVRSIISRLGLKLTKEEFMERVPVFKAKYPIGHIKNHSSRCHPNGTNYQIKTENGWMELGRYAWENHYGEIPKDHCVVFLNGNNTDTRAENLALVPCGYVGAMNLNGGRTESADITKLKIMVMDLERLMEVGDEHI